METESSPGFDPNFKWGAEQTSSDNPNPTEQQAENPSEPKISRRDFIKTIGKLGAAAVVGALELAPNEANAEPQKNKAETRDIVTETLKKDWEAYKREIEEGRVPENIEFIDKRFGEIGRKMTFKAKNDLLTIDTLRGREQAGMDLIKDPNQRALLVEANNDYVQFWDEQAIKQRAQLHPSEATLSGFEQLTTIDAEKLKTELEARYSRNWLHGTVDKIEYVDKEEEQPETFPVGGRALGMTLSSTVVQQEDQIVKIYRETNLNEDQVVSMVDHELAHHNDWKGTNALGMAHRLQFLRAATERFDSPDRMQFTYVDQDIPKDSEARKMSKEETEYRQVMEYWASVVEEYFRSPKALMKQSPKDFALADVWYKRISAPPKKRN